MGSRREEKGRETTGNATVGQCRLRFDLDHAREGEFPGGDTVHIKSTGFAKPVQESKE